VAEPLSGLDMVQNVPGQHAPMSSLTGPVSSRTLGRPGALDKLVDDLGSRDDAVGVVRTFAATLSWRASRIERSIVEGQPQASIAVISDLRNAAIMVGAKALAQWCRRALASPHTLDDPTEILELAAATLAWLEAWVVLQDSDAG
jgi:hypothetical protein